MASRLILLVALATLGVAVFKYVDERDNERELQADYRVPAASPPVEPDRPDLFEDPSIDEKPQ